MPKNSDISSGARWKTSPDIASRKVAEELVLLNVKTSEYYSMNPTAVLIWDLLSRNMTFGEIVSAVTEKFETGEGRAVKDAAELLGKLEAEKMITRTA